MITEIIDKRISGKPLLLLRDDRLSESFGGNKVRIAHCFLDDAVRRGANAVLIYGSPSSNLCRILSNLCRESGIYCAALYKVTTGDTDNNTVNRVLCAAAVDAVFTCGPDNVAESVTRCMGILRENGLVPYYIYDNENIASSFDAYFDVMDEIVSLQEPPEILFVPVGTGITYCGLCSGAAKALLGGKTPPKIVGISVSRTLTAENVYLEKYFKMADRKYGIKTEDVDAEITEIARCGGYNIYNEEILRECGNIYFKHGIPADPVYVGKAYWGMVKYMEADTEGAQNKRVMFIHTGSSPCFIDAYDEIISAVNCDKYSEGQAPEKL